MGMHCILWIVMVTILWPWSAKSTAGDTAAFSVKTSPLRYAGMTRREA